MCRWEVTLLAAKLYGMAKDTKGAPYIMSPILLCVNL
jgi:hypothetical protein